MAGAQPQSASPADANVDSGGPRSTKQSDFSWFNGKLRTVAAGQNPSTFVGLRGHFAGTEMVTFEQSGEKCTVRQISVLAGHLTG